MQLQYQTKCRLWRYLDALTLFYLYQGRLPLVVVVATEYCRIRCYCCAIDIYSQMVRRFNCVDKWRSLLFNLRVPAAQVLAEIGLLGERQINAHNLFVDNLRDAHDFDMQILDDAFACVNEMERQLDN
jgi:hypothetical protein